MPETKASLGLVRFHGFQLDLRTGELRKDGGETILLSQQPFQILTMLLDHPSEVVSRQQIQQSLWPGDTIVEFEHSISAAMNRLRQVLGDSAESPRYIETLARRGYRFIGPVEKVGDNRAITAPTSPTGSVPPTDSPHPAEDTRPETVHTENASTSKGHRRMYVAVAGLTVIAIGVALWSRSKATRFSDHSQWVQLTQLPDAAVQPALSPDGRMLAFLRGSGGEVYVKILPDGEPVQLTHDGLPKFVPAFSPDGSRIAYTTMDSLSHWDTWVVPTLGGEPQPFLRNASGLVWTGPRQVLFSEVKSGIHMGIVAAQENRIGARDIYLPEAEPAMAHRSYLSPDGKWVLVVEMDQDHTWLPCRVVPMDGKSQGRHVGPLEGGCTYGAWSPDGKWMYFTANPGGASHIWRQHFPDGWPEQITFGPTEEQGIAMAPDGHSFVTAAGLQNEALWIHDGKGERPISLEGNSTKARFTPDGKRICYLTVREASNNNFTWHRNPGELRIADLASGRSEPLVRGFPVLDYDISADGTKVVMSIAASAGKPQLWLAPLDRGTPPVKIPNAEGNSPRFGPGDEILFRRVEQTSTFVYRVHPDGTGLRKARPEPIFILWYASPDGRWFSAWAPDPGNTSSSIQLFPLDGGPPIPTGGGATIVRWSLDGRAVLIPGSQNYLVPLPPGEDLPRIEPGRFAFVEDVARAPGARRIDGWDVVSGPSPDVYAFHRGTTQQNLYRIPVP